MSIKLATALIASLSAALIGAAGAHAGTRQVTIFQDDRELFQRGSFERERTLDEARRLGVDVIKFSLDWASVAPNTVRKPPGYDGANLSHYVPGAFVRYDALVASAQARGFRVMIQLNGPAPGFATARRGDRRGVHRPSGREFARFAEAVGRRYPSVRLWTIWNEPNLPRFLSPQGSRRGTPIAPSLYRGLVAGAVRGLRRSGHGRDRILFGELLPIGKTRVHPRNTMKPLLFLREFFCVNRRFRPYRARAARGRGCRRYRRVTGVNGFAHHPYTRPSGPRSREPHRDDATIRSIGRITRTLDRARRARRIRSGRLAVWNTEFGYQSRPPDRFQTPIRRIPGFINEAEWMTWRNRRVASYSQYTMRDHPLQSGAGRYALWQGGLRFASGRAKPGVYGAFRSPIFVRLLGPGAVEVWGAARPGGRGTMIQVQQRRGRGRFVRLGGPIGVGNPRGYFRVRYRIPKAARRVYRFQYVAGGSRFTSRAARAVVR